MEGVIHLPDQLSSARIDGLRLTGGVASAAPGPCQTGLILSGTYAVGIAHARHGSWAPLVIATCWLSHLPYNLQSPVWRHTLAQLASFASVIRHDERGHGLSDWNVRDPKRHARITDLEPVVDRCRC